MCSILPEIYNVLTHSQPVECRHTCQSCDWLEWRTQVSDKRTQWHLNAVPHHDSLQMDLGQEITDHSCISVCICSYKAIGIYPMEWLNIGLSQDLIEGEVVLHLFSLELFELSNVSFLIVFTEHPQFRPKRGLYPFVTVHVITHVIMQIYNYLQSNPLITSLLNTCF